MKKLLMSSVIMIVFSIATVVTQVSCQKTAVAQSGGGTVTATPLDLMVFAQGNSIYTAKTDGANKTLIPITMPTGLSMGGDVRLTADGAYVIFTVDNSSVAGVYIYKCSVSGGTPTKIVDNATTKGYSLGSVN